MVDELDGLSSKGRRNAEIIVGQYLNEICIRSGRMVGDLAINTELTEDFDIGWVFYWNTARYWKTGAIEDSMAGNAPLFVSRGTNEVIVLGTGKEASYYVDWIRRHGKPSWR